MKLDTGTRNVSSLLDDWKLQSNYDYFDIYFQSASNDTE